MQAFRFEPLPQAAAAEFGAFQSDQGVRDQGRCFREDPGRENPKLRENPRRLDIIPSQNTIEDDVLFPKVVYILGN